MVCRCELCGDKVSCEERFCLNCLWMVQLRVLSPCEFEFMNGRVEPVKQGMRGVKR